jgi:tetratricopeptide (TPR) repeat protein
MNGRCFLAAGFLALLVSTRASALDRVRLYQGAPLNGQVAEMSPTQVKLEVGAIPKKIEVNQIDYIEFDEDPKDLKNTRTAMKAGKYPEALALVNKVKLADIKRNEVKQDAEFYKAILMARLALAGSGSRVEAGKLLLNFEKNNSGNYHYLEACEVLGDLLVADGKYDKAEPYYAKLSSAPWPDYRVRAAVLTGRALEAQKQYAKAIKAYDDAQGMEGDGNKDVERQKLSALLGKATSLAASGKADDAVKMVDEVIAKADPENLELHARAYNALGACFKAAGKSKEALLAYLHVDVLYAGFPEQHAEALANLATLWAKVDKADRATQAREQLKERYPNSQWAQK